MKKVLHKILSVFLAFTVLFSTLSFSVDKHICMGEVTNTSYFTEADSCGMEVDVCNSDNALQHNIKKEKCCDSVYELISGNQVEQQALLTLEIEKAQFILAFAYTYINLSSENSEAIIFNFHPPPLVDKDITVLYQTFLI